MNGLDVTVILPARDEARSLERLLPALREACPSARVLVVNDGSTDDSSAVCAKHGVEEVRHPHPLGNGAAIKAGARAAKSDVLVFMDADFQHDPSCIAPLLEGIAAGADMVVGARSASGHAGAHRRLANALYSRMASWMTEQRVPDLTSGLRAARRDKFLEFLHLLPNGFSYPTTITMAFLRAGYVVLYHPIETRPRVGTSHISLLRDGSRFLLIIFKIGTLYSPLKLFMPISASFFLIGLGYYAYTYLSAHRFTNMSALLLTTSVLVFLIGLVSEQITALQYSRRERS